MKKAKVLIPAIAVLALSAASAVTGTVAWFTASRTVGFEASKITVVNTEGGIDVTLGGALGGVESASAKAAVYKTLTDGSVDMSQATPKVYKNVLKDGAATTTYKELIADTSYTDSNDKAGKPVYRAAKYTATFTLADNTSQAAKFGLFFDKTQSAAGTAKANADQEFAGTIAESLRIGFKTADVWSVWAPFKTISPVDTFVDSTSTTKTYPAANILTGQRPATASNSVTILDGYLGDMNGNDGKTLAVDVWTWYEGTDSTCISGNVDDKAWKLDLQFAIVEKLS